MDLTTIASIATPLISAVNELMKSDSPDKEHIELLKTKNNMLVELIEPFKEENENLIIEVTQLRKQVSEYLNSQNFVEQQGAAFKLNVDGTYSDSPYCISCHSQLPQIGQLIPYMCPVQSCRRVSGIKNTHQLKEIVKKLNSNKTT